MRQCTPGGGGAPGGDTGLGCAGGGEGGGGLGGGEGGGGDGGGDGGDGGLGGGDGGGGLGGGDAMTQLPSFRLERELKLMARESVHPPMVKRQLPACSVLATEL